MKQTDKHADDVWTAGRRRTAIWHDPTAIWRDPTATCHDPTAIRHDPTAICHDSIAICHGPGTKMHVETPGVEENEKDNY